MLVEYSKIHFQHIFERKVPLQFLLLIGYIDPQKRSYLLAHFLLTISNPTQQSSLLSLSKLFCFLPLSILAR